MKKITILGNNSGRNAGDAAILDNMLRDITETSSKLEFHVPSTHPGFIKKHFAKYNAKPVPLLPWYGAVKNFGLPLFKSMLNTDLVLICDNILFDRKFYNPLFNNLASISLVAPWCKKRGIPIVLYNVSIGPIDHAIGKKALQKVLDASPLVTTRDTSTKELFDDLDVNYPELHIQADCALNTLAPGEQRLDLIIAKEGLFTNPKGTVGFNVNAYIDNWSMEGTYSREDFSRKIAASADKIIEKLDVDIIFFVTQVMDTKITQECIRRSRHRGRIKIISNVDYDYTVIAALLGKVELHIGLRTHTLIFSAAMNTPMVGITSYPKSTGFLKTIQQERWQIPFQDLTPENVCAMMVAAWAEREQTRATLAPIVKTEKQKARHSARLIQQFL